MSLRSLTTCSYVSDATSFAMRHCTIVVTPLPMFPEPDSFRPREIHHRPNASCLGNKKKSPCRWWLIDGCKSLFNVKPSTVPTRLIPELDAHTRTTHPERFLRAEKSRRPNTQHQMGRPSMTDTLTFIHNLITTARLMYDLQKNAYKSSSQCCAHWHCPQSCSLLLT